MADAKISALAELTQPDFNDLLVIIDDPAGIPADKKIQVSNLLFKLLRLGLFGPIIQPQMRLKQNYLPMERPHN
jgi:hypothetical protein